ncbi:MAG: hypothetical protein ACI8S6_002246, partial [Myxococcota bacterium]
PDDKAINEFDEDDVDSFCEELSGDPREVTCDYDGVSITFTLTESYDECVEIYASELFASCSLTAGEVRECQDAYDALSDEDFCSLEAGIPAECEAMFECAFGF